MKESLSYSPREKLYTFSADQGPKGSARFKDKFWSAFKKHLWYAGGAFVALTALEFYLPFISRIKLLGTVGAGIYGGVKGYKSAS